MSITVTPIPRTINPNLLVQSGTIAMWSGLIANIPDGWFLCDGSNSTPDLRTRFVQGAADGVEAGGTGGSSTATPANHSNHTVTQPSAHAALGTHQHLLPFGQNSPYNSMYFSQDPPYGVGGAVTISDTGSMSSGGSSQSVLPQNSQAITAGTPNAHSGTAVNAHSAHSTSDSRPPFYAILYIMKS